MGEWGEGAREEGETKHIMFRIQEGAKRDMGRWVETYRKRSEAASWKSVDEE